MRKLKILFCLVLLMVVVNLNIKVKAAEQLPDNGAKISSAQRLVQVLGMKMTRLVMIQVKKMML